MTILVVDDVPANVRLLDAVLTTDGHSVVSASSGEQALEIIRSRSVDLVVLDIQMPGMTGYDVCRAIRAGEATAALPVIMVTASGNEEKLASLHAGADDFIPRPFDRAELLARVRSLLRIKRYHDTITAQAAELNAWNRELEEQVNEQVEELARLNRLRGFLPAPVAAAVQRGDESMLQPHRTHVAVIFADLRKFTTFALAAEPDVVLEALREFHDAIGSIVRRYHATIGHFAGDGVMMFFNDPIPCRNPEAVAANAALALCDGLAEYARRWRLRGHELGAGVGLASGSATLGLLGFDGHYEYTAIGPVVNRASRLCDQAEAGQVLIADDSYRIVAESFTATPSVVDSGAWLLTHGRDPETEVVPSPDGGQSLRGTGRATLGLLGPLEVRVDGVDVAPSAGRVRRLLATLLLHHGQVVSVDQLVDELWDGQPPATAVPALRVHVSRLRKHLSMLGLDDLLTTRPSGYQITADAEQIDTVRFTQLAVSGGQALRSGRFSDAVVLLREGLELWRGPALVEVASCADADAELTRLEELRLQAIEDLMEAEIARGNHREILAELEASAAANPFRERLCAHRMTALYRSGRQPDALAAYQHLRRQLADELGLDPSPELVALNMAILTRRADTASEPPSDSFIAR